MATPTYISLFSGAGGGDLANQWLKGWRCVCYVERDPYAVEVLRARIRDGLLNDAPIWDDVSTFDGTAWAGLVDGITAGFPCQPFSVAGKRKASADERNGWPATIRIINEVRPAWCFLENVAGLLAGSHGYFGVILAELAQSGFTARWKVLSAAEVGAPHKRDRLWIVAHTNKRGRGQAGQLLQPGKVGYSFSERSHPELDGASALAPSVAHSCSQRSKAGVSAEKQRQEGNTNKPVNGGQMGHALGQGLAEWQGQRGYAQSELAAAVGADWAAGEWWSTEPDVGRVAHGVAARVDRLRCIGNGQVPAVARIAWNLLTRNEQ